MVSILHDQRFFPDDRTPERNVTGLISGCPSSHTSPKWVWFQTFTGDNGVLGQL